MSTAAAVSIRGTVCGGVVVFEPTPALPEGAEDQIVLGPLQFTPEEAAEFAGWEQIGDEAWAMIDEWEKEEQNRATG